MEEKRVKIIKEGGVAHLVIESPATLNALDNLLIEQLLDVVDSVEKDNEIVVLIISGSGKAFVAGADIKAMSKMDPNEAAQFGMKGATLFRKIEQLPQPVIAAINGYALGGGCELALACDIRIASSKAKMGQPEVTLGITPGFSATVRLPKVVGVAKAKELIYTGKVIGSQEALEIGLLNEVVEPEELLNRAREIAAAIAKNSPVAVRFSKEAINIGGSLSIDDAIRLENNYFSLSFAYSDQREGMEAFIEKREANFKIG
ncbi:MAG: enoyl-CoA hydratase-related protein [Bacteroidales bacterium]